MQGFKLDRPEDRVLAANVACQVAGRHPLSLKPCPKWLSAFVGPLVGAAKDKNSGVCAAAEEALVAICNIDMPGAKGNEAYSVSPTLVLPSPSPLIKSISFRSLSAPAERLRPVSPTQAHVYS